MMDKKKVLKEYFGYDEFRPLQAEIIDTILAKQDSLVLMPTGGGKSICFQIPALIFDGLTIVISPIIALMKDQVEALRANGIKASFLNSSLNQAEQDAVMWAAKLGELKLLYIAPEKLFSGNTLNFLKELNISLFAIDEAHCISSWGHDFRPEYRQLHIIREEFKNVPIVALTATADKVTRKDICKQLNIPEENIFISSFDRPNIHLSVLPGLKRLQQIQAFLNKKPNESGIIYCLSRNGCESLAASLRNLGFNAAHYHAGMSSENRSSVQERFLNDDLTIIVATIAFGMGIDKSNVRFIIHYNMPSNVESFYQEIGRAGRDGNPADSVLFYSYADVIARGDMIRSNIDTPESHKELLEAKLDRMKQYAEASICRRRILINYFNEDLAQDCGNCDVCNNPRHVFDATVLAQKVLSAIARTNEKIALTMLIDILRGSRNQNVLRNGYEQLKTFGIGKDLKYEVWVDYILQMLNYGVMDIAYDEGHTFKLNATSVRILKGQQKVEIAEYKTPAERKAETEELSLKKSKKEVIKTELFEILRVLRKQIADATGTLPYIIFSDATLSDMAEKKPIEKSQFLAVSGVGQEKLTRYGDVFMAEIKDYILKTGSKNVKLPKGQTHILSYELYKDGHDIEEIAAMRGFTAGTIASHLIKAKDEGKDVDLRNLIDNWTFEEVKKAVTELNLQKGDFMKPIFEHLNEQIGYDKIRITLALMDEEK